MPQRSAPTILVLRARAHRAPQDERLSAYIEAAGGQRRDLYLPDEETMVEELDGWLEAHSMPRAILRWDEMGGLYGERRAYRQLTRRFLERGGLPLYVDFAYFNHYRGYLVDRLLTDNRPSIAEGFGRQPDRLDFSRFSPPLRRWLARLSLDFRRERERGPLETDYEVAAFVQAAAYRCRLPLGDAHGLSSVNDWVRRVHQLFGDRVIFKTGPYPQRIEWPHGARRVGPEDHPTSNTGLNLNLALHGDFALTNNSGVTSELILFDIPVVVTGRSWYSGLGVFEEVASWEQLGELTPPRPDRRRRSRYVNWWAARQVLFEDDRNPFEKWLGRE